MKTLNEAELLELVQTSAYTITGAGGDLEEWVSCERFAMLPG